MENENFHKQVTEPMLLTGDTPFEDSCNVPEKIGEYKIEGLLERGGMSILYLGTHPETKKPTAIKVLLSKYVSNPEIVKRFLDEAEIISMADHPNIVKLFGHGEWEEGLYIAMEFIEGISLRQYLLRQPFSLKQALEIIIDIAYALCHLHTHGVIHRDLKPENILFTESGAIKLIDFGIAQLNTEGKKTVKSSNNHLIGTPIYMSPEQRDSPDSVSYPSDLYSLGIITYELVLGKLCHGRIHLSLMPKGLKPILTKMLQPNPNNRYQDTVDFISDVTNYMHSKSFEKESLPIDQLSEAAHHIKQAQQHLLPLNLPKWPHAKLGVSLHKGLTISGIYYDFFISEDDTLTIVCVEPEKKGIEGVIYTATIRGIIKTLFHSRHTPINEIASTLNKAIYHDSMSSQFQFSIVTFSHTSNTMSYTSSGQSPIWISVDGNEELTKLTSYCPPLGELKSHIFEIHTLPWNVGSSCFITSYTIADPTHREDRTFLEEYVKTALQESKNQNPQHVCDELTRKMRISTKQTIQNNSIALIGIQRV
ncbi:MAG: protein kinase [Chlamydiota bacterium]|nr:protein kinase [Chlamydiota bacterium]